MAMSRKKRLDVVKSGSEWQAADLCDNSGKERSGIQLKSVNYSDNNTYVHVDYITVKLYMMYLPPNGKQLSVKLISRIF